MDWGKQRGDVLFWSAFEYPFAFLLRSNDHWHSLLLSTARPARSIGGFTASRDDN